MAQLWLLALVGAPASFLSGFAAAAMSFTAWNLIVPLMFAAFGLPVFQALFISVMLDVCNGITLTLVYGRSGKVDFRYGTTFGAYAAVIGVSIAIAASNYIVEKQEKLKTASSFVPLLIAIQFLVRGLLALRNKRRTEKLQREQATAYGIGGDESAQAAAAAAAEDDGLTKGYVAVGHPDDSSRDLTDAATEVEEKVSVPRTRLQASPNERTPLVYSSSPSLNAEMATATAAEAGKVGAVNAGDDYIDDEQNVNQVSSWRFWLYLFTERFTPDEDILHRPFKYMGVRIAVTLLVFAILGGVAGLLYAGGGMFYANIIVNAWGAKIRTAAGTGCFIMTMVMVMIAFTFIGNEGMDDINNLYHVLVTVPFGVLGSLVGARLALRISDMVMFFVIFGVSMTLFIYIVVQNSVLADSDSDPDSSGPTEVVLDVLRRWW